jgi:hypothetical protein
MVALQNRHNKGVTSKIVQDKELRVVSASAGGFWLKKDAGTMGEKLTEMIVQQSGEIICKPLRWGQRPSAKRAGGRSLPYLKVEMCANRP